MNISSKDTSLRVAILHPELGVGGGERVIVDAALQLQKAGHKVTIFTTHRDRNNCFEETSNGTLDVRVHGDFLPSHIGGHLRAPCTIARMAHLACASLLGGDRFDVVFCDLVPHVIPLIRFFSRAKIVFYCHYPDRLLSLPRDLPTYRWYRAPIDRLEEAGMRMADRVLVNSMFTASEVRRVFPRLHHVKLEVLYPGVDPARYNSIPGESSCGNAPPQNDHGKITILSINRFERKKNIGLAIESLARLREILPGETFNRLNLIIAGGYDGRLPESREVLRELRRAAREMGLEQQVVFKPSCSDAERLALLSGCLCVLYTPDREHFGLVPLEAMAARRPVVAVRSGGPVETILHAETGFLCDPTPEAFADAILRLLSDPDEVKQMGRVGRRHAAENFSRDAFGVRLEGIMQELAKGSSGNLSTSAGRVLR